MIRETAIAGTASVVDAERVLSLQDRRSQYLNQLLRQTKCAVLKDCSFTWVTSESKVTSSPIIEILDVLDAPANVSVMVSFVSITESNKSELHYHDTHSIGVIVSGSGTLVVPKQGYTRDRLRRMPLTVGDVVAIPRGALHVLECDPNGRLDFIALDFCDPSRGGQIVVGPGSLKRDKKRGAK
jgi:mannose-6-phosphate isomerase-like protein (cupin superfamily)